jgi:hypothetical protein
MRAGASPRFLGQAFAALLLAALAACDAKGPESPKAKHEFSVLQALEFEGRGTPLQEPIVREVQSLSVLGVAGQGGQNVWVLLRAESEPYYKQMPPGVSYVVPSTLVERLEREGRVSAEVDHWLRKGGGR